jgi:hypothetical protein
LEISIEKGPDPPKFESEEEKGMAMMAISDHYFLVLTTLPAEPKRSHIGKIGNLEVEPNITKWEDSTHVAYWKVPLSTFKSWPKGAKGDSAVDF